VSPPLAWDGAPAAAKALVLIVDDPDARGFIHWVAFDIPATTSGQLPEGLSISRYPPRQGKNGFGRTGWGGPCPPSGTHHYRFRLIAVSQELGLPGTPTAGQALKATEGKMVAETTLVGVYRRG
jgi:Raf kinase inhibitor-like YbhB/YbcL family protein